MTTMALIAASVAERHGLTVADLKSPSRVAPLVRARHEAFTLCMATERFSSVQVGRHFNRTHKAVLHGVEAHERRVGAP